MQNPNTEPNPKETVSQEEIQQQETQQQNNDNKLLSPMTSILIQPRLRAPTPDYRPATPETNVEYNSFFLLNSFPLLSYVREVYVMFRVFSSLSVSPIFSKSC